MRKIYVYNILMLKFYLLSSSIVFADTIAQITPLSFGMLQAASTSSKYITIDPSDGTVGGSASLLKNNASRGHYLISCNSLVTAVVDVQNISTGNPQVILTNVTGYYGGVLIPSFPVVIIFSTLFNQDLYIGGTLVFSNLAPAQNYNITANIILKCSLV